MMELKKIADELFDYLITKGASMSDDDRKKMKKLYSLISRLDELFKSYEGKVDKVSIPSLKSMLKSIETINRLRGIRRGEWKTYNFLEDVLPFIAFLDDFYPYRLPEVFFQHPNIPLITLRGESERGPPIQNELDIFLYQFPPGSITFRFGRDPIKISSGILDVSERIAVANLEQVLTPGKIDEISRESLPFDYPFPDKNILMIKPLESKYKPSQFDRIAPRYPICPTCLRIPDGDETHLPVYFKNEWEKHNCPECQTELVTLKVPPETNSLAWYEIIEPLTHRKVNLPTYPFNLFTLTKFISTSIKESGLKVKKFVYGIERRNLGYPSLIIYYRYGSRPCVLGYAFETDAFSFELNEQVLVKLWTDIISLKTSFLAKIHRDLSIQYMYSKIYSILKNPFDADVIVKAVLWTGFKGGTLPINFTLRNLIDFIKNITSQPEEFEESIRYVLPAYVKTRATDIRNTFFKLAKDFILSEEEFRDFIFNVTAHTFAHILKDSVTRISGALDYDVNYFYQKRGDKYKIYIFDAVDKGNGVCETAHKYSYIRFSERINVVRELMKKFAVEVSFLPSTDLAEIFEENLLECPIAKANSILFDFVTVKGFNEVYDAFSNEHKRASLKSEVSEMFRGFCEDIFPDIEYGLRTPSSLLYAILYEKFGICYEDLFMVNIAPHYFLDVLLADAKYGKLLIEVFGTEEYERLLDAFLDAIYTCVHGCPECTFVDPCIYGGIQSQYRLNKSLASLAYYLAIKDVLIENVINLEESSQILTKNGFLYFLDSYEKPKLFEVIFQLLGAQPAVESDESDVLKKLLTKPAELRFERAHVVSSAVKFVHSVYRFIGEEIHKRCIFSKLERS
ncbi:MAG: hypothetical protein QXR45_15460 [Candidatus Bathyarchaeia archaeon]